MAARKTSTVSRQPARNTLVVARPLVVSRAARQPTRSATRRGSR